MFKKVLFFPSFIEIYWEVACLIQQIRHLAQKFKIVTADRFWNRYRKRSQNRFWNMFWNRYRKRFRNRFWCLFTTIIHKSHQLLPTPSQQSFNDWCFLMSSIWNGVKNCFGKVFCPETDSETDTKRGLKTDSDMFFGICFRISQLSHLFWFFFWNCTHNGWID